MKIMYIIALVSFFALAGAAVAITRHVRKNARRAETPGSGLGDSKALEDRLTDVARGLRPLPAHATLASAATTPPGSAPEGPGTTPSDDTPKTAKVEDPESKDIKSGRRQGRGH